MSLVFKNKVLLLTVVLVLNTNKYVLGLGMPLYLTEDIIKEYLTWPSVFEAVEQSLLSVSDHNNKSLPHSNQPPRTFTFIPQEGALLSMPGFLGNYQLPSLNSKEPNKIFNTLACKLVTSFSRNEKREPQLPNILGTVFLYDTETGRLKCILEGTGITEIRTAAASLVATKHLYFNRKSNIGKTNNILSIIGTGVQGRGHSIGMLSLFDFSEIRLWNRSKLKAIKLAKLLENPEYDFKNKSVRIIVADTVEDCLRNSDVIVTSTGSDTPLVYSNMLKSDVHINAVGSSVTHYTELSAELYKNATTYIDNWASANTELKGLDAEIVGQVGDVISNMVPVPTSSRTIFQSLGMGIEDAAVAEMIYEKYQINQLDKKV